MHAGLLAQFLAETYRYLKLSLRVGLHLRKDLLKDLTGVTHATHHPEPADHRFPPWPPQGPPGCRMPGTGCTWKHSERLTR